jgi:hypothetical protein
MIEQRSNPVLVIILIIIILAVIGGLIYNREVNYTEVTGKVIASEIKCYEWRSRGGSIKERSRIDKLRTPSSERPCPVDGNIKERFMEGGPVGVQPFGPLIGRTEYFTYAYASPVDGKTYKGQMFRDIPVLTGTSGLHKPVLVMAHKSKPEKSICDGVMLDDKKP